MLRNEFTQRANALFPAGQVEEDDDGQQIIYTGWYRDPDEGDHVYTDGNADLLMVIPAEG